MTCRYCWNHGHSQNTCPRRAADIETIRANNPNDWRVLNWDAKKQARHKKGDEKKCSWCDTLGHDRRSCETYIQNRAEAKALQGEIRSWFKSVMKEHRVCTGNFVTVHPRTYYGETKTNMFLIDKVNLDNIKLGELGRCYTSDYQSSFRMKPVTQNTWYEDTCLQRLVFKSEGSYWQGKLERLAAEETKQVDADLPEEWLTGETGLDTTLKPSKSRYAVNSYSFANTMKEWKRDFEDTKTAYQSDLLVKERTVAPLHLTNFLTNFFLDERNQPA